MVTKVPESGPAVPQRQCKPCHTQMAQLRISELYALMQMLPALQLHLSQGVWSPPVTSMAKDLAPLPQHFHSTSPSALHPGHGSSNFFYYSQTPAYQILSWREFTWNYRRAFPHCPAVPLRLWNQASEPGFAGTQENKRPSIFSLQLLFLPRKTPRRVR